MVEDFEGFDYGHDGPIKAPKTIINKENNMYPREENYIKGLDKQIKEEKLRNLKLENLKIELELVEYNEYIKSGAFDTYRDTLVKQLEKENK